MGWQDDALVETQAAPAPWMHDPEQGPPSNTAVALNAIPKALASIPDAVLNAPTHLYNLGKAAYGSAAYALGYKDLGDSVTMSEPPNLVNTMLHKPVLEVNGKTVIPALINEKNEPQTANQRLLDTTVQGATAFALAPAEGVKQVMKNLALGATTGAVAQTTKEATGSDTAAVAVGLLTPLAVRHGLSGLGKGATNEVLGETLKNGIEAGLVVPPSAVKSQFVKNRLESFGGKAAVAQQAKINNQQTVNQIVAQELGQPKDTIFTPGKLDALRDDLSQPYRDIANISKPAAQALQDLRQTRHDSQRWWSFFNRNGNPGAEKKALALDAKADRLETVIYQEAKSIGVPELADKLKEARTAIAKTYDVERALNVGTGNIDSNVLGNLFDKGRPMTGGLRTIATFDLAFRKSGAMGDASGMRGAGISALEPIVGGATGAAGYAAGGPAGAAIGMGVPLLRGPARSYLLSKGVQNRLLSPSPTLSGTALRSGLAGMTLTEALDQQKGR